MFMSVSALNELNISGTAAIHVCCCYWANHTKVVDVHGFEVLVRKEATQVADVEDGLRASAGIRVLEMFRIASRLCSSEQPFERVVHGAASKEHTQVWPYLWDTAQSRSTHHTQ